MEHARAGESLRLCCSHAEFFSTWSFSDSNSQKRFRSVRKIMVCVHWTLTLCGLPLNCQNYREVRITLIFLTLWLRKAGLRETLYSIGPHNSWAVSKASNSRWPHAQAYGLGHSPIPGSREAWGRVMGGHLTRCQDLHLLLIMRPWVGALPLCTPVSLNRKIDTSFLPYKAFVRIKC